MPDNPIIQMIGISKSFGPVRALENVNFTLGRGEIAGLVGDNGAGKSTLLKILSGVLQPDKGEILYNGKKVVFKSPQDARKLGIEAIYQDLALCDDLNIYRNIFLSREIGGRIFIDKSAMRNETLKILRSININIPSIEQQVKYLSGGQRQSVAIARAMYFNAQIILMDEPTAALGVTESKEVFNLMLELKKKGRSIVFITHNLRHIFSVVDRITVLYKGRSVAESLPKEKTSIEDIENLIAKGTLT